MIDTSSTNPIVEYVHSMRLRLDELESWNERLEHDAESIKLERDLALAEVDRLKKSVPASPDSAQEVISQIYKLFALYDVKAKTVHDGVFKLCVIISKQREDRNRYLGSVPPEKYAKSLRKYTLDELKSAHGQGWDDCVDFHKFNDCPGWEASCERFIASVRDGAK